MTNAAIRQQLHQYIDTSDDKKIEALYILLQDNIETQYKFSDDDLSELHERAEQYLKGDVQTYSVDESHEMIRKQRKK